LAILENEVCTIWQNFGSGAEKAALITFQMVRNCCAGNRQIRFYGAGKLTRAVDLALDKILATKYSLDLEESCSEKAKSPKNGDL